MKRIAFMVLESAWAGSITLPMEILDTAIAFQRNASASSEITIDLLGLTAEPVTTYSGIQITPQLSLDKARVGYDAVIVPAIWDIDTNYLVRQQKIYPWLCAQYKQGALVFGFLTGAYLMAEAGILDGATATTHWHYANDFRHRYPKVNLKAEAMQTADKGCYCCGGVNASLDLIISLIHQFCSPSIAQLCERHCLMGARRNYQKLTLENLTRKQHQDSRILAIQDWIDAHYAEPIRVEELAARFGFSTRNLNRRFTAAAGISLQRYIQEYRLEIAKSLLTDTQLSIQQICFNTGYESLTVFGRRFKAYTGCAPSQYRRHSLG